MRYEVTAPDGTRWEVNAPEGASEAEVMAYAQKQWQSKKPATGYTAANLRNFALSSPVGAMARGVKDVIDTGAEFLSRAGGRDEQARVRAMNETGKAEFKAASESLGAPPAVLPSIARFGGNMLATAPAVTALGGQVARVAPRLGSAISTGGMTTGAAPVGFAARAGDMGIRMAGGAAGGAVAAGMVDPESAAAGAAIGAAFPPLVAGVGRLGAGIGNMVRGPEARAGTRLADALEIPPADLAKTAEALRRAQVLVPGSQPTVAQALQTPQAGILERVVSDSAGGARLKEALAAQAQARAAALEGVAPTAPAGYATARQDLGEAVARFATAERGKAKAATRAAYEAVPQDEAALYLPDLGSVRDRYFGPGVFTDRANVDRAVQTAQQIGTTQAPAVKLTREGAAPKSLAQAVRAAGGLSLQRSDGFAGELRALRGDAKNLVRNSGGESLSRMAMRMHEAGYIADDSADTLIQALKTDARSSPQFSSFDLPERQWQAALERSMGDAPAGGAVPKKVTLREFDNLRKSIGQIQRAASADPARATEAKALADMKAALDDRINEVVRGDGAVDEVLPIAWADALDEARRLKLKEVERFMTGPQAAIFRRGADGQPLVQGGEVAAKFWGQRPGLADDVRSFRRLIDDNPTLLGQFRSMVTTEGAETAGASGNLAQRFVRWFESRRPGLAATFDAQELQTLERIAADIKRAEAAAAAGAARGSNTYQNASNALGLGLLDSPAVRAVAGRVPYLGGGVDWARDALKTSRAQQLAEVLADSQTAANALMAARPSDRAVVNALMNPDLRAAVLRAAPLTASDR